MQLLVFCPTGDVPRFFYGVSFVRYNDLEQFMKAASDLEYTVDTTVVIKLADDNKFKDDLSSVLKAFNVMHPHKIFVVTSCSKASLFPLIPLALSIKKKVVFVKSMEDVTF